MAGLQFEIAELVKEIKALRDISKGFLEPGTIGKLDEIKVLIEQIWNASEGSEFSLKFEDLKTVPSKGAYEWGGRRGGLSVYALISGRWDVKLLGYSSGKGKTRAGRKLEFCGNVSTTVEVRESGNNNCVVKWNMDIATTDSPGCYFHIQIPNQIPIPRIPSLFVTPMGAIEFVIGEMFQEEWEKATSGGTANPAYWRALQAKRLKTLLLWQRGVLEGILSTPWMALKRAKPNGELFLDEK
ncbi:MAG: hypothetical protein IIA14_16165 [SAR324 cluster bacterium]|nr:hypothetical protein [SAR324 cluster bacterium]